MSPAKEKDIKDKLYGVWEKELIRVKHIPNGWIEKRASLGKGTLKLQGTKPVTEMLETIEDFGVDIKALGKMNPNYEQIHEIFEAIKVYRIAVRYLKALKEHMSTFDNFKWWEKN